MHRTIRAAALAAATAAIVTACGGSSLPTTPAGAPRITAVAKSIGCTGFKPSNPPTMFASSEGFCRLHGRKADLVTFTSPKFKQDWERIAGAFAPKLEDGPDWAAYQMP
jgi:hypothetical protein